MKIMKYVAAAFAAVAMTLSFSSCSRDLDPDVDSMGWYRCEVSLDNQGSLSEEGVAAFEDAVNAAYGLEHGATHYFSHCTKAYMESNYNATVALSNDKNEIFTKIIAPVVASQGVSDFTVKFAFEEQITSKNAEGEEVKTVKELKSVIYKASDLK